MPERRTGIRIDVLALLGVLCGALFCCSAALAADAPAPGSHLALVIGESAYRPLPPLPVCAGSARSVGAALRHDGFAVTQLINASNGEIAAALTKFGKRLAHAPGSTAVLYFCGYAAGLNARGFLLPVEANIERRFDVITQGIVATSALTTVAGPATAAGLLVLDVFPRPGDHALAPLARLTEAAARPGDGYLAVAETHPNDAQTPLTTALVAALSAPTVETGKLVDEARRRVATIAGSKVIAAQAPTSTTYLAGGPPPAPAPAKPPPAPPPKQPTAETAVPAEPAGPAAPAPSPARPAAEASAPPAAATGPLMPDEAHMSDADRRRVQAALALLGYYSGRIDGVFGPETRAAIRRFQHEIGVDMTGELTAAEAQRLVAQR